MIEVLPIKVLTQEDTLIFGSLNVALGKLYRLGLSVADGVVITPPNLALKTILENYDFSSKQILEQSLTIVKKELRAVPIPDNLNREIGKNKLYLNGQIIKSAKDLWYKFLDIWIDQIKQKFWDNGFYVGITDELNPQVAIFVKEPKAFGSIYFDPLQDDSVINIKSGSLHPNDLKKLDELVKQANKKLIIPHGYEWILDGEVKLVGVLPYTPSVIPADAGIQLTEFSSELDPRLRGDDKKSVVKVFLDLSKGIADGAGVDADGIYIASEKIFDPDTFGVDLNKPSDSFEDLVMNLVEAASYFKEKEILFKLADKSEGPAGMGKVRGTLRLLHQKNLLDPILKALDFARHKKMLHNIHIVIPFVRTTNELLQIKRELSAKNLSRKNSLKLYLELCTPENMINLEEYLVCGVDGVVINLDELISYLNGFDPGEEEVSFYKNEVSGLIKFLEHAVAVLHKSKIPFLVNGTVSLNPAVLEFLVEKGVLGVVVQRYEAQLARDLFYQTEKKLVTTRAG